MAAGTVQELLDRWEAMRRKGHEVSLAELCRDQPELLPDLEEEVDKRLRDIDALLDTSSTPTKDYSTSLPAPETVRKVTAVHDASTSLDSAPYPTIPRYEILGVLGKGGMGIVYKACQVALKRIVALKMIASGGRVSRDQQARFAAEAEAVARFQHPNIVQIYEVGEHEDSRFFSMEFVDGGSLERKLEGEPLPCREAAALIETLAKAVHYAHERGIVHRDLKPGNVLLTKEEGIPKITDFGLALEVGKDARLTQSGAIMGTPCYMAPEQAGGKTKEIGPLADVYALGAILYELLTGQVPFKGASTVDTILQVISQQPPPPRSLSARVPRDLEAICLKCLEKEPSKRYESAELLAEDLRRFLLGEPVSARPIRSAERTVKWARRRPVVAALLVTVAIAAVLAGINVWYLTTRQVHSEPIVEETFGEIRKLEGHTGPVNGVAYSPDGRLLVSGGRDTTVRLWDAETGMEKRVFKGHSAPVNCVSFSSDGKIIASCGEDSTVRIWDTSTGEPRKPFKGSKKSMYDVSISPDGRFVLGGDSDGTVRLWDIGKEKSVWKGKANTIRSVAFSPTGNRILTGSLNGAIYLWDAKSGEKIRPITGHNNIVRQVIFLPDGESGVSVSGEGNVYLLDLKNGKVTKTLRGHLKAVWSVAALPGGKHILTGSSDSTLVIWELESGRRVQTLHGHEGGINRVAVSPDGKYAASASGDKTIRIWRLPPLQTVVSRESPME